MHVNIDLRSGKDRRSGVARRSGMERRKKRFYLFGDDRRGDH